jgi:hypothetical protein
MPNTSNYNLFYVTPLDPAYDGLWGPTYNALHVFWDGELATRTINYNFADKELQRPILRDYGEKLGTASFSSGTLTLDLSTGNHFKYTLTANVTSVVISNPSPTGNLCPVTIKLKQASGASYTVTGWNAAVKWANGTPTMSSTNNATDKYVLTTDDAGTTYDGVVIYQNVAGL